MSVQETQLVIRGRSIREDQDGLICLDDIWALSGEPRTRRPKHWRTGARTLISELLSKVRNSDRKAKITERSVIYANRGRTSSGTYAHALLAVAYAAYLSPKLKLEVLEVWLRYRKGDAALADEILERASSEDNLRVANRAMGRVKRRGFTDTLQRHGVVTYGYGICTDAIYVEILGAPTKNLKANLNLPKKANLRDNLDSSQLAFVAAAEALATDRIEEEDPHGNYACARASQRSARFIREAIERDKMDRQRSMLPKGSPPTPRSP